MEKDMNQYVLSLLENYPQMIRKIELMRYELRFAKAVTPQEMIEVMTYAKKGTQVAAEMPRDDTRNASELQRHHRTAESGNNQ